MKPNKFIIEKQVSAFRTDNGLSASEPVTLKSLLLKLNILTVFRPLSDNFSGMCLKDNSGHRFMLINSNQPRGRQHFTIAHELYHLFILQRMDDLPYLPVGQSGISRITQVRFDLSCRPVESRQGRERGDFTARLV